MNRPPWSFLPVRWGSEHDVRAAKVAQRSAARAAKERAEATALLHAAVEHHRWARRWQVRLLVIAVLVAVVIGVAVGVASAQVVGAVVADGAGAGPAPTARLSAPPPTVTALDPSLESLRWRSTSSSTTIPVTRRREGPAPAGTPRTAPAPVTGDIRSRVAGCESGPDGAYVNRSHGHAGSSASGKYGYLRGTWQSEAPKAGVDLSIYPEAYLAPEAVQDAVFDTTWAGGAGASHWNASRRCWGR